KARVAHVIGRFFGSTAPRSHVARHIATEYMPAFADATELLPDALAYEQAAPIFCAGYTVWSGLRWADPQPHERVAVVGIGRVGTPGGTVREGGGLRDDRCLSFAGQGWPRPRARRRPRRSRWQGARPGGWRRRRARHRQLGRRDGGGDRRPPAGRPLR